MSNVAIAGQDEVAGAQQGQNLPKRAAIGGRSKKQIAHRQCPLKGSNEHHQGRMDRFKRLGCAVEHKPGVMSLLARDLDFCAKAENCRITPRQLRFENLHGLLDAKTIGDMLIDDAIGDFLIILEGDQKVEVKCFLFAPGVTVRHGWWPVPDGRHIRIDQRHVKKVGLEPVLIENLPVRPGIENAAGEPALGGRFEWATGNGAFRRLPSRATVHGRYASAPICQPPGLALMITSGAKG